MSCYMEQEKDMIRETKKKIYVTNDYSIFKALPGNRPVKKGRVVSTMDSIQKIGWITEPVVVNENYEVIDGQGRLEALKELKMPVEFVVEKNIGVKECQILNRNQKNWTTMDYVDSYAKSGNDSYLWLKSIIKQYQELTKSVIFSVAASKGKGYQIGAAQDFKMIEAGLLKVQEAEKKNIEETLLYLLRFVDVGKCLGGRKDKFYTALSFLYLLDGVDKERLYKAVSNARFDGMVSSSTVEGYLQQFEIVYNKSLVKKKRVDMMHAYKIA